MLYGLLMTLFVFVCFLLIMVVLVQQSKGGIGGLGGGGMSGGAQMLFGGSGGQDLFQKTTWILGVLFMGGSLMLALYKTRQSKQSRYLDGSAVMRQRLADQMSGSQQAPAQQKNVQ